MTRRLLSALVLIYLLGYALFVVMLPLPADDRRTDGIVVLTGSGGRMERGFDLLRRKRADRMLISGVARSVRPVELVKEYDVEQSLFDCCIDLGRESVDTRSNAEETVRWLEQKKMSSVRLVTTDWHMPRARFELSRQLGGEVELIGDSVRSRPSFRQLFKEYNKFVLRQVAVLVGL
jgi:uncharacterized SAM-binding protein YcdF (DUF218 family)